MSISLWKHCRRIVLPPYCADRRAYCCSGCFVPITRPDRKWKLGTCLMFLSRTVTPLIFRSSSALLKMFRYLCKILYSVGNSNDLLLKLKVKFIAQAHCSCAHTETVQRTCRLINVFRIVNHCIAYITAFMAAHTSVGTYILWVLASYVWMETSPSAILWFPNKFSRCSRAVNVGRLALELRDMTCVCGFGR